MAVGLNATPAYPIANRPVRYQPLWTGGGNYVRIWCTNAPPGSKIRKSMDETGASRFLLYAGDNTTEWVTEWDKSGTYSLAAQEYRRGASTTGGGYDGSPSNAPSETKTDVETALTVSVADRLEIPLGLGRDTATLVLFVHAETIRATTIEHHGILSPAIINPGSDRAKLAAEDATVKASVEALKDAAAAAAIGNVYGVIDDFVSKFNAHRILTAGTVHASADNGNAVITVAVGVKSIEALIAAVTDCRRMFDRHARNDVDGSGTNSASPDFHSFADTKNLLLASPAAGGGDMAKARAALADLHRAYEAHRHYLASVHGAVDNTNALMGLPVLLQLDSAWCDAVVSSTPTAPATANSGTVSLVSLSGGKVV
jgi:hypothetical protein